MSDMCTDNRFELVEEYKKELVKATNIESSPEEMKVLDNILFRFWQIGWLDSIDRMPLVKESAMTLMRSGGDSVYAKALRNAGRFIQNAIDGEAPEFEKIPSASLNCSESPNGWRSCSESPEYDFKDVLIRWHDKRKGCEDEYILCEGYVVRGHWCSIFEDLDVSDYDPIEWMPLSSAYKRGEQDE